MKTRLIVHPIMFALFPFLFFYAHNLQEFQALSAPVVFALLAFVLGLTALFWFVFNLVLKNPRKSALATSILVLIIFTYGHFYGFLEQTAPFVPGHAFLILAVLAGFGGCLYFIRRNQRNFGLTTFFLNTVSSVLIVINAFSVIAYEVSLMRLTPPPADSGVVLADDISYMPDIYLIILDEYAHADTLEKHFDYDNSDFLTGLEKRGFYIAEESTMHNEKSVRAIASILNMENTPEDEDRRISHQRIKNNRVVTYLNEIGYDHVYFGNWYEINRYTVEADEYYNYYEGNEYGAFTAEMVSAFLHSTMLRPLYEAVASEEYQGYYQDGLTQTLEHLAHLPRTTDPRFVFAHLLTPHSPFIFDQHGQPVDPDNYYDPEYYVGQLIYTNEQIENVIDSILANSNTEPIIILQSDHGPRWTSDWEKVLNAYYLPGDGTELLHPSISPIDSFRVILNHYFDAGFEQ